MSQGRVILYAREKGKSSHGSGGDAATGTQSHTHTASKPTLSCGHTKLL